MTGKENVLGAILETSDIRVLNDINNPVFDYRALADKRIEITSIRSRSSRYRDELFAEAGFRSEETGSGLIRVGGTLGRYLLKIEPYRLPVWLILRSAGISSHGNTLYNWERV